MAESTLPSDVISTGYTLTLAFSIIGGLLIIICTIVGWIFVSHVKSIKDDFSGIKNEFSEIKEDIKGEFIRINNKVDQKADELNDVDKRLTVMERNHEMDIRSTARATAEEVVLKLKTEGFKSKRGGA